MSDYFVNDGQWYFITGVFDGTNSQTHIYVNGQLEATAAASTLLNPDNSQD